jgi:hypothetical protein
MKTETPEGATHCRPHRLKKVDIFYRLESGHLFMWVAGKWLRCLDNDIKKRGLVEL